MRDRVPTASLRRICRVLQLPRSALYPHVPVDVPRDAKDQTAPLEDLLVTRMHALIQQHPTYGYRRIWAILRFHDGLVINRKRVYRLMRRQRWLLYQRRVTPKPRVTHRRSIAAGPNERWAMDVTHIACGADGWAHLTTVIDCYDREIVGFELAVRSRAKEAE